MRLYSMDFAKNGYDPLTGCHRFECPRKYSETLEKPVFLESV